MSQELSTSAGELLPPEEPKNILQKVEELQLEEAERGEEAKRPSFKTLEEFAGKVVAEIVVATGSHGYSFEATDVDEIIRFTATRTPVLPEDQTYEHVAFAFTDGTAVLLTHHRSCCEGVCLQDVEGDFGDLIGRPLITHEEVYGTPITIDKDNSETWTFYRFASDRGMVVLRWVGSSSGYYSESVDLDTGTLHGWFGPKLLEAST